MYKQLLDKDTTTYIKAVAILYVILSHLGYTSHSGNYGVAIFLILSGFGLTLSYLKTGTQCFVRKRADKVLLPYMLITAIWFIWDAKRYHRYFSPIIVLKTIIGLKTISPVDLSMWYITYLIIWYIIFYNRPVTRLSAIFLSVSLCAYIKNWT